MRGDLSERGLHRSLRDLAWEVEEHHKHRRGPRVTGLRYYLSLLGRKVGRARLAALLTPVEGEE